MIDFAILEEFGTTDDRLRQFFSAKQPTARQRERMTPEQLRARERDVAMRQKFERSIHGILQEHIVFSLSNHSKYSAVDMMWDSLPIQRHIYPLIQYAQGRMDLNRSVDALKNVPNGDKYVRRDKDGKATGIDIPKFTEININLGRSIITRRVAAQAVMYNRLDPFYKYEPRDQSEVGKLRGDMVSQRMEIMTDQYGYRHFQTQLTRDMFMYGHSVAFPRAWWEREVQIRRDGVALEFDTDKKIKKKSVVVKEGLSWFNPHPSRVFYDNNFTMSSINTDTGCEYIGFWDVCRWGEIADNPAFFNKRHVAYTSGMVDWFSTYWAYFNQYFTTIIPPSFPEARGGDNVTSVNDRKNQVGLFTGHMESISTIFSNIYMKVRPQNWGWGTYPYPVWVHLKIAGDATVVYAKILPSSPAAYFGFNENDSRMVNLSLAHQLMPYQDQLTNLYSQLLEVVKQDLLAVCVLNEDVFPNTEEGLAVKEEFRKILMNKELYASTQLLECSFTRLAQLNIDVQKAFIVVRSAPNTNIEQIFKAITQVIAMANTVEIMSPMEQGQKASGGEAISAHESVAMTTSTDTMYNFVSESLDEGRSAIKRISFESLVACGSDQVELTVENRYPDTTIQAAGFTPKNIDGGDLGQGGAAQFATLMGDKMNLVHDFIFTSRDGANRPAGVQAAQALTQFLQGIGSLEADIQKAIVSHIPVDKLLEIVNTIVRSVDAGVDLALKRKSGEPNYLTLPDGAIQQSLKQLEQGQQQLAEKVLVESRTINLLVQIVGARNPQLAQMLGAAGQGQLPGPSNGTPSPS